MSHTPLLQQQFESCLLGGAIGDAWGSTRYDISIIQHTFKPTNIIPAYLRPAGITTARIFFGIGIMGISIQHFKPDSITPLQF